MAYEKLNLKDGTVLNEEHLAHIENGIEDAETVGADAVLYTAQTLTEEQKLQARTNIGAMAKGDTDVKVSSKAYLNSYKIVVTVNGVESEGPAMSLVRYDVNQTGLTEEQKAQARANIGVDAYIEQVFLGGEW